MQAVPGVGPSPPPPAAAAGRRSPVTGSAAALGSAALGLGLGLVLHRFPAPLPLVLAGGLVLLVLALALARYDAAVALAFGLLGVATVQPAPSDAIFLVLIAVAIAGRRLRLSALPATVVAALAVFAALYLLSAVEVRDAERAASSLATTLLVAAVAVWLCSYVSSPARARLVVRGYLTAAVASAAAGTVALLGPVPGDQLLTEDGRARGLFQDPDVFGAFLVPALLIAVEEIVRPRLLTSRRPVKVACVAILALGVLFCYSRGAWANLGVGLVAMGAVLALRRGGGRRVLALLAVCVAAALVAVATVAATGSGDVLVERAGSRASDDGRFSRQLAGIESTWRYPFGVGPGQFESVTGIPADSIYARVLGEQGILGLFALLALLCFTLGSAVRSAAAGRGAYGMGSAALLGAWLGLLVNSLFADTLHWRHLWIVAALVWTASARRPRYAVGTRWRPGAAPSE